MKTGKYALLLSGSLIATCVHSQTPREAYDAFRRKAVNDYHSFLDDCNRKYSEFLKKAWKEYSGNITVPLPEEKNPVPPRPYQKNNDEPPVIIEATVTGPIETAPRPKPVGPVMEAPYADTEDFTINFYRISCHIRMPAGGIFLNDCSPEAIATAWDRLSDNRMNNAIRDCLEIRIRYNLCDWAYLQMLKQLSGSFCLDKNTATLLMAYIYCQSGYQMRLAVDGDRLTMLFGSKYQIYDLPYFSIGGNDYYPVDKVSDTIRICDIAFEGETPLSLSIDNEQKFGILLTNDRIIRANRYPETTAGSNVDRNLIDFFNTYPSATINGNPMTRWAIYADTPLSTHIKDRLYPALRETIAGRNEIESADILLDWVQTGFEYEYDDKVWGHDRAFFCEETLYYPYCDCEDRAILFSRLIRDLLHLDVALVYYPNHLATAVCFDADADGDAVTINGRRFVICDPTYIGAPVGRQMPGLEYDKTRAIVLRTPGATDI